MPTTGVFTVTAADIGKSSQFPALITQIEVKATGETASQWQSVGTIANGKLNINMAKTEAAGKMPVALKLYEVTWSAEALAGSTAIRTALNLCNLNGGDARITTKIGDTFTFLYTDGCDFTFDEELSGNDANSPRKLTLTGGGTISSAVYVSGYTQHT